MVNLSPITFLSIGYTLLVVALNVAFLKYEMGGGKNLRRRGWCIMGLAVVLWAVVWVIVWLTQALSPQEWGVFAEVVIAIALTGFIPALRGEIQKKPKAQQPKYLCWGMFAIALVGVAFIAAFITCALKPCC
jgi:drug/metabolite transporter (DMT)-like permease